MRPQRPTGVLVIAILQFVFGGLGILCGLYIMGASQLDPQMFNVGQPPPGKGPQFDPGKMQVEMDKKLNEKLPIPNKAFNTGSGAISLILSVMMVLSGVGLLQVRAWGRILALLDAVLTLLMKIVGIVYYAVFVRPVMSEMMDMFTQEARRQGMGQQEQAMLNMMSFVMSVAMWAGLVLPILQMIYPVVVLIVLNTRKVRLAFQGVPVEDADYDQRGMYEDRDDRFER